MTSSPTPTRSLKTGMALVAILVAFIAPNLLAQDDLPKNYKSVWQSLFPDSTDSRGVELSPLQKAFYQTASCTNLDKAIEKWQAYTQAYAPDDEGFEDAVHERYWTWAKKELKRSQLLKLGDKGRAKEVEAELKEIAEEEGGS